MKCPDSTLGFQRVHSDFEPRNNYCTKTRTVIHLSRAAAVLRDGEKQEEYLNLLEGCMKIVEASKKNSTPPFRGVFPTPIREVFLLSLIGDCV